MTHSRQSDALAKLDDVAGKLRDANTPTGMRRYERYEVRCEAELQVMDDDHADHTPIKVAVHEISRGGVAVICQRHLVLHSTWRLCFLHDGHVISQQPVIVRHCMKFDEDWFFVGAQFCIETGLMCLLGVSSTDIFSGDMPGQDDTDPEAFMAPGEVA